MLTTAGLENVAERADIEGWQEISAEVVVDEDPAWIVYPDWTDEPPIAESIEETTAYQEERRRRRRRRDEPARPGIVDVIVHLVETVHPDVYAEIESDLESIDEVDSNDDGETDGDGRSRSPDSAPPPR